MYGNRDLGGAISALFYSFIVAIGAAVFLAVYVLWQTFFGLTPWDICSKMDTEVDKIEHIEAHNELYSN